MPERCCFVTFGAHVIKRTRADTFRRQRHVQARLGERLQALVVTVIAHWAPDPETRFYNVAMPPNRLTIKERWCRRNQSYRVGKLESLLEYDRGRWDKEVMASVPNQFSCLCHLCSKNLQTHWQRRRDTRKMRCR